MISTSTSSQISKCKSPSFQQPHPILVTKIPRYKRRDLPLSFLGHTTSGCKCYRYRSPAQRLPEWPSKTITPFSWASAKEVLGNRKHCEDKPLLLLKCDRLGTLTNYSLTSRCLKFDVGDWQVVSTTCLNTVPPQTATEQSCKAKIGAEAIFLHFLQNMQMGPLPLQFWSAGQICVVLVPLPRCSASERMTTLWLKFQCVDSKPLFHSVKPMSTLEKHQLTTTSRRPVSSVQCPSLLPADICKRPTVVSCASSLMKQPNPAGADISEIPKPHSATKEDCHHLSHPANLRRPLGVDTRIPSPCRRSQSCWCRLTSSFSWTS